MNPAIFWHDFINAFHPPTIHSCTRPIITEWSDILTQSTVYVNSDPRHRPLEPTVDLLYLESHIGRHHDPRRQPPDQETDYENA